MYEYTVELFNFLNGRTYTGKDGIQFKFAYKVETGTMCHKLLLRPTKKGKESEAYRKAKREYGDDWYVDCTDSDMPTEVAYKRGFSFNAFD